MSKLKQHLSAVRERAVRLVRELGRRGARVRVTVGGWTRGLRTERCPRARGSAAESNGQILE